MASSTPSSSPVRQQHNPHPYSIKTTTTGILTRSNSSKAHGSWSRHHFTPVPPSPSAILVFDPSQSTPSPTRTTAKLPIDAQAAHPSPSNKSHLHESPQKSEKGSPSPSKYSKTWIGRNSAGEQVSLPRHPYLWTPPQLATYLSTKLNNSDGDPLDLEIVQKMTAFIQQKKIGGRTFLSLDLEDFQEMEGVDSVWSNALWDASCTLRQEVAPYRPSRISSSSYKRGRVRGIVNVFERSASESSDVGDDETHSTLTPNKLPTARAPSSRKRTPQTPNLAAWSLSESEDDSAKITLDPKRRYSPQTDHITTEETGQITAEGLSRSPSPMHINIPDDPFISQNASIPSPSTFRPNEVNLVPVLPPPSETATDLFLVSELPLTRDASPVFDDTSPHKPHRDVEIASEATNEDPEPTMEELYAQTYGIQPPSSRAGNFEHPELLSSANDPLEDDSLQETVKLAPPRLASTSAPPTALRPVARRRANTPPQSLRRLFLSTTEPTTANKQPEVSSLSDDNPPSSREQAALRTLEALKERLEVVESRLQAMETKEAGEQHELSSQPDRKFYQEYSRSASQDVYDDFDDFAPVVYSSNRIGEMAGEALRSWQSKYILLAGMTGGVSVVLIPMLLRHFWSR